MTSLWAIIKLTCKSAVRSYVFQLLLFILVLTVFLLPNTIIDDGTALGHIKVSLKYCFGLISFILSLSTIWISCFVLSGDIESYQLHLVITKPVSRIKVWIGKWFGIVLIHAILLFLSSAMVYGFILWQFYRRPFNEDEKLRIKNEVLVGRRVTFPDSPDIDRMVRDEYNKRLRIADDSMRFGPGQLSGAEKKKIFREVREQVIAGLGEVKPSETHRWSFSGLNPDEKSPLYLRYRIYIGSLFSKGQTETTGMWYSKIYVPESLFKDHKGDEDSSSVQPVLYPKTRYPEKVMGGVFHEFAMNPVVIGPDGTVTMGYTNLDPSKKSVFFQLADGPKLMVRISGFGENYLRAVFVVLLRLFFLAGLGCMAGGLFSMPTAVFIVVSYLFLGIFSSYLVNMEKQVLADTGDLGVMEGIHDTVGRYVSHALLLILIPLQEFEVSDTVAEGELVEFSAIGRIFLEFLILRGCPLFIVGIWLYRRKEMGLIIRK